MCVPRRRLLGKHRNVIRQQFVHRGVFHVKWPHIPRLLCDSAGQSSHLMFPTAADITADPPPCLTVSSRICDLLGTIWPFSCPHVAKSQKNKKESSDQVIIWMIFIFQATSHLPGKVLPFVCAPRILIYPSDDSSATCTTLLRLSKPLSDELLFQLCGYF